MGRLLTRFEGIGKEIRLEEGNEEYPAYRYSFTNFRDLFLVEYLRECSCQRSYDPREQRSLVYMYPTLFSKKKKRCRQPVLLDSVTLFGCLGEDAFVAQSARSQALEIVERSRSDFRVAARKLRLDIPCDLFNKVWKQSFNFRKRLLFKAMWAHLLPEMCLHQYFGRDGNMSDKLMSTDLHGGIHMKDFFQNEKSWTEAVKNARSGTLGDLFSLVTGDYEIGSLQLGSEKKIVKDFGSYLRTLFAEEGSDSFEDRILLLRTKFYRRDVSGHAGGGRMKYFREEDLEEGTTSVGMFRGSVVVRGGIDGALNNVCNFGSTVQTFMDTFVMTRRFLEVANQFYQDTLQVYIDLEDFRKSEEDNEQTRLNLHQKENERLNTLSAKYGVERGKKGGRDSWCYYK